MNKRKAFSFLLLAIILFSIFGSSIPGVKAQGTTLKVAFFPLKGFFEYDSEGNESGYGVDVLDKITQYTGIHFEYVQAKSWEETKEMLLDGRADVRMPGTIPTVPSKDLDYTKNSVISTYHTLLTMKNRDDIYYGDQKSFAEIKVAITSSLYKNMDVKSYLSKINIQDNNIICFEEYNNCKEALVERKVDALVTNIMDLTDDMKMLDRFNPVTNHISFIKGSPYVKVFDDALERLKLEDSSFLSNLNKEYYPERETVPFTKEEQEYLANHKKMVFAFKDGQGFMSRKEKNGFVGMGPKLAKYVCEKLGVAYQEEEYDKLKKNTNETFVEPDFFFDYAWAQQEDVTITEPYMSLQYYQIERKKKKKTKQSTKVIAVKKSNHFERDFAEHQFNKQKILWCDDYDECIHAVQKGKADVTYMSTYVAEYYMAQYEYNDLSEQLMEYQHELSFAVHQDDHGVVISILNKVLSAMSNAELDNISISVTAGRPQEDFWEALIYEKPAQSLCIGIVFVSMFLVLIFMIMSNNKNRKQAMQLVKATEAKNDFFSQMSHDIRTPMNAIIGFSELCMEQKPDLTQAMDYMEKINYSAKNLLQLINDELDLSKVESGKIQFNLEPTALGEIKKGIVSSIQNQMQAKNIDFTMDLYEKEKHYYMMDKLRMQQILLNLLSNAAKFTPKNGTVLCTISVKDRVQDEFGKVPCCIKVTDTGIGMSKDFIAQMYEPFSQENSQMVDQQIGTGLGLTIVNKLVNLLGGEIHVESQVGKGTTFSIYLQLKMVPQYVEKQDATESRNTLEQLNGKRILLVEDHPLNQQIAVTLLNRKGITVDVASNGQIGVQMIKESRLNYYDAILMDIRMPVMDGILAAKTIRSMDRKDCKTIPIVAMTANAYDEDKQKSKEAGMNAHLSKPIDPNQLFQTLNELLKK